MQIVWLNHGLKHDYWTASLQMMGVYTVLRCLKLLMIVKLKVL